MNFSEKILSWYDENQRDLPWRTTKDPYKIWLSEIIMQQTQIVQGTSYYIKFIETYPTIFDLAKAGEQDVLLIWQGLGYYSRARNMYKTAVEIVNNFNGKFPDTYEELIKFKGIGDYTASAISSVCFNKVHPAIDGNALRLISRIFEISEPVNKNSGKKKVKEISQKLISKERPGDFNQAVMDFGSQQCKVSGPDCEICILNDQCLAFQKAKVSEFPVKVKPGPKSREYYYYFIFFDITNDEIIIKQRSEGIWINLYEFPKIISEKKISDKSLLKTAKDTFKMKHINKLSEATSEFKHILSHKVLFIKFYRFKIDNSVDFGKILKGQNYISVKRKDLKEYPFPIIIKNYIETQNLGNIIV